MNIKTMTAVVATAATSLVQAATPQVTSVSMAQSSSSRLVTIAYTLENAPAVVTLDVQTNRTGSATGSADDWVSIGGKAVCNAQGDVWKKVGTSGTFNGTITWRPDHSWPDHVVTGDSARAVVTAWALDNTPDYMVVDISDAAKPGTQRYYPVADFVPGGVTNSLYKTTTFLMRKIMAKDVIWTMGSVALETQNREANEATHQVTLTNNYYIGVYEVTQSQWWQVATNSNISANFTTEQFMRPMEKVCYNEIRLKYKSNAAASSDEIADYSWPKTPNPSSFLGLLRSKTGVDFDLPSEAQWEFAARSGNGVGHWNDGSDILTANPDANLNLLGRYLKNPTTNSSESPAASIGPSVGGTAIVGSYAPNDWGLYDMHGNVWEWCLDFYEANINAHGGAVNIDPQNPANNLSGASSVNRVIRGGSWKWAVGHCRPARRRVITPTNRDFDLGFRVLCYAGLR